MLALRWEFCMDLRTDSDLCHLQHKLIGFYNRDEKCLQRGTDWFLIYGRLRSVFKSLIEYIYIYTHTHTRSRIRLWRHYRARINCVVINECHSKRGVWLKQKKHILRQNTCLLAYYLNIYSTIYFIFTLQL